MAHLSSLVPTSCFFYDGDMTCNTCTNVTDPTLGYLNALYLHYDIGRPNVPFAVVCFVILSLAVFIVYFNHVPTCV
jgi:hypothetical protein